jgi:hypothetical protein
MRMSDAPFVPSQFRRVTSRELLRKNEILVYLSGVKKPPQFRRGLLTLRVSGLSKPSRADEWTRTAGLRITSVRSSVSGRCRGLQIPHRKRVFHSPCCPLLQGVACGLGSTRVR